MGCMAFVVTTLWTDTPFHILKYKDYICGGISISCITNSVDRN
ncbi:MAG: hypothetical protein K0R21_1848 [Anaerocolumna sp.]|jgi:hypothetical protein|nr:hypothetical protein [Anaerocolumna sp.]